MDKKVGIVTLYHKTYNYGAQLQSYALQKIISDLGYICEVINYQWCGTKLIMFYEAGKNVKEFRLFSNSIPHSTRIYTPHNIKQCVDEYDIFVCGSDQIWGVNQSMPIYVLPQITLSFVPEHKVKFSYAASMGGAIVSQRERDALSPWVAKLDAVSVRESSAISFVKQIAGKEVITVLDPTMLINAAQWIDILNPPINKEKYIFVYNVGNNIQLNATAEALAEKLNLNIVSLSFAQNDTAGPKEFLGLIYYADLVLTNSYHGTIYSILFHKPFYTFCVDDDDTQLSKNIRITDLLSAFNLFARYINVNKPDINRLFDDLAAIDYKSVDSVLNEQRKASMQFLSDALEFQKAESISGTDDSIYVSHEKELPQSDYINSISNISSEEKIYYENKLINEYLSNEEVLSSLYIDMKRLTLVAKLNTFINLGLSMNDNPDITGNIIIYGAGQVGKLVYDCFDKNVICYIDRSEQTSYCRGLPIYNLTADEVKKVIQESEEITVVVTPVRDCEEIGNDVSRLYNKVNVVFAESLVDNLWI